MRLDVCGFKVPAVQVKAAAAPTRCCVLLCLRCLTDSCSSLGGRRGTANGMPWLTDNLCNLAP